MPTVHSVSTKTGTQHVPHHDRQSDPTPSRMIVGPAVIAAIAAVAFLAGNTTGVILSPDLVAPTPTADWKGYIDAAIAHHLASDHPSEVSPSPSASPALSPKPTNNRATSPTASPRPKARPTPMPTVRPVPSAVPSTPAPTPCFRPGKPQSGKDPCSWPVDG